MKLSKTITFGAVLLATSSIGSYVFGLLRDRLLAGQFGASTELDIYSASFLIPDFIMNLFAAALTSAFVPVFAIWQKKYNEKGAWELTNHLLLVIAVAILLATVAAFLLTPFLTKIIAPGFEIESSKLLIQTTRLMIISPLFFSLSILFGSALQAQRRFIAYALSPIFYNFGIVIGLIYLAPKYGIYGAIIGVLFGGFLHMIIRFIELVMSGWKIKYLKTHWDGVAKTVKLMIPRAIGLISWQTNLWIYTAIASGLTVGSIAIFNLARNFQSLPVSLFGIAFATSMFPALASHYAKKDLKLFQHDLSKTIKQVLFFSVPAAMGMAILSEQIVSLFLEGGKFDEKAVLTTGIMLSVFALSIPLESVQHVLARGFYARHDTVTPVKITLFASLINILVSLISVEYIGVNGLALGFVSYSLIQLILLTIFLRKKIGEINGKEILLSLLKITLAAFLMASIILFISNIYLAVIVGAGIYLTLAFVLKIQELDGLKIIINKITNQ